MDTTALNNVDEESQDSSQHSSSNEQQSESCSDDTQPMTEQETQALLRTLTQESARFTCFASPSKLDFDPLLFVDKNPDFDSTWDNPTRVKFPCSNKNTYRLRSEPDTFLSKWKLICDTLSSEMLNSQQLADCIISYNPTYVNEWTFDSLHQFCATMPDPSTFWNVTLPFIANTAMKLDKVFKEPVPLLSEQISKEITLTHEQCAVLLANMFFCTFPQRSCNSAHGGHGTGIYSNFPNVNFNTLFSANEHIKRPNRRVQKLECIIHYFETLATKGIPAGKVSFRRQILETHQTPLWDASTCPLIQTTIKLNGTIEDDGLGCWQADFANMVIGGGVIGAGCVQEEIRFVINPECLIARLLAEKLAPNEAVIIIGPQRYSNYTGYRDTFAFAGHHEDLTPRDSESRIKTVITAIDAVSFPPRKIHHQFSTYYVERELNKAYVGFLPSEGDQVVPIATGHWGCGAFNGDKHLKALIQLMAASEAGRELVYFAFGDYHFERQFGDVLEVLQRNKLTVGDLFRVIKAFEPRPEITLFEHVLLSLQ